jgi:hypothetical protein
VLPRYPLTVFVLSRAAIWAALVYSWLVFESYGNPRGLALDDRMHDLGYGIQVWARWDSSWFLGIADEGYSYADTAAAYFPLYPVIVGALGRALGGHFLLAGVIVSLAATGAAFVLLFELARQLLGDEVAQRSVLYLALFPMSFFLGAVYSEAIYLALAIGAFLLAEKGRFGWAAIVIGGAMLTRTAGVAVLIGVAVIAWRSANRSRAVGTLALALPIAALYPAYLQWREGDAFAFLDAQHEGWGRTTSWWGPLEGIGRGLDAGYQGVRQLLAGPETSHRYWNWARDTTTPRAAAISVMYVLFLVLFVALAVYTWRRLGAAYGVFCVASLALPLSSPTDDWPLLSLPRFGLAIFPIFIALGVLGRRRNVDLTVVIASTAFLGVMISQWVTYYFVS